jgi:hypothetical protein
MQEVRCPSCETNFSSDLDGCPCCGTPCLWKLSRSFANENDIPSQSHTTSTTGSEPAQPAHTVPVDKNQDASAANVRLRKCSKCKGLYTFFFAKCPQCGFEEPRIAEDMKPFPGTRKGSKCESCGSMEDVRNSADYWFSTVEGFGAFKRAREVAGPSRQLCQKCRAVRERSRSRRQWQDRLVVVAAFVTILSCLGLGNWLLGPDK